MSMVTQAGEAYFQDWLETNEHGKIQFRPTHALHSPLLAIGVGAFFQLKSTLRVVEFSGDTLKLASAVISGQEIDKVGKTAGKMMRSGGAVVASALPLTLQLGAIILSPCPITVSAYLQRCALEIDDQIDKSHGGYPLAKAVNELCGLSASTLGTGLKRLKLKFI